MWTGGRIRGAQSRIKPGFNARLTRSIARRKVAPEWGWFWHAATLVVPIWEGGGLVSGTRSRPRDLVSGQELGFNVANDDVQWPWVQTLLGRAVEATTTNRYFTHKTVDDVFPRHTHGTVFIIRRKTDATNRASSAFGADSTNVNCHMPWSDGNIYFDWGGTSGGRRLTISGLNHAGVQRLAFTAGPSGLAMYQDGILRNSNTTSALKSASSSAFRILSGGVNSGDLLELIFFATLDEDIPAHLVQQWSASPFGPFYMADVPYFVPEAAVVEEILGHGLLLSRARNQNVVSW